LFFVSWGYFQRGVGSTSPSGGNQVDGLPPASSLSWESLLGNSLEKLVLENNHKNPKDKIFPEDKRYDLPSRKIKDTERPGEIFIPK
jgi:hypothetical protein